MDILCLNIKLTFPMQSSVNVDAQNQHFSESTAVIRSTTNGVMTLQPHPCHINTYALTILSTFVRAPFTLVHPLIICCVMHHPCPIAPSVSASPLMSSGICTLDMPSCFHATLFPRTIIYAVHMTGYVWEHFSFHTIGGTFVDGVWSYMTHPHA